MINRSQLGKTTMDNISSKRIRPSRPKGGSQKKSRKLPQKPSYLSTPKQQLIKALSKARRTNTSKEGLMIDPARFLSKAENQRSRLGLGEAKNVGKKYTVKDRPGKKTKSKKRLSDSYKLRLRLQKRN
jgi:hypothetical protein